MFLTERRKNTRKHLHFNKMLLEVNRYRHVRNNIQLGSELLYRAIIDLLHFLMSFMGGHTINLQPT
jgi:hypothetical protein